MRLPSGWAASEIALIQIEPLRGLGEIAPGANLPLIAAQALKPFAPLHPDDILVVTQKIVSKAENCFTDLADVAPGEQAIALARIVNKDPRLVELVLRESSAVVRAAPHVLITRHRLGFVMANAGVDQSNLGENGADRVLRLPADPDRSARDIRAGVATALGHEIGVVISDSFGRPWREGVTGVAIGAAGLASIRDQRGVRDRNGRVLEVTRVAWADAIAAAAGLVMGEAAEGVPMALVRGVDPHLEEEAPANALVRPVEQDLFR
jgi:coenzyme F420-0:L-glutamate ligase / coenzyme F420-1:gamma-L-glutamate ligase